MIEITPSDRIVPCQDIEPVRVTDERKTLERFAGVEYERCCWSARLVSRRFLNNRSGGQDTALFAQIELKGLTSIGARVDAFLERGILGYGQD